MLFCAPVGKHQNPPSKMSPSKNFFLLGAFFLLLGALFAFTGSFFPCSPVLMLMEANNLVFFHYHLLLRVRMR